MDRQEPVPQFRQVLENGVAELLAASRHATIASVFWARNSSISALSSCNGILSYSDARSAPMTATARSPISLPSSAPTASPTRAQARVAARARARRSPHRGTGGRPSQLLCFLHAYRTTRRSSAGVAHAGTFRRPARCAASRRRLINTASPARRRFIRSGLNREVARGALRKPVSVEWKDVARPETVEGGCSCSRSGRAPVFDEPPVDGREWLDRLRAARPTRRSSSGAAPLSVRGMGRSLLRRTWTDAPRRGRANSPTGPVRASQATA